MVSAFARLMGAPPDRNLIDWSLNAGVNVTALLRGRNNDTLGIGYGWAHVSGRASDLDSDIRFFTASPYPVRGSEQFIEVTYQCQVTPWWIIQPDLQYIIDPRGGVPNPFDPSKRTGFGCADGSQFLNNITVATPARARLDGGMT